MHPLRPQKRKKNEKEIVVLITFSTLQGSLEQVLDTNLTRLYCFLLIYSDRVID